MYLSGLLGVDESILKCEVEKFFKEMCNKVEFEIIDSLFDFD